MTLKSLFIFMVCIFLSSSIMAMDEDNMTVAADGSGDFKSLTEAIDHLPFYNYKRIVIYVKNGVYNEKIRIDRDYLTIRGENRDSTIIQYAQLREDWENNKDFIGPAVINIHADDIILDNMTIKNTQAQIGPHAFAIYGTGTRTIILNCNVTSKGGDTVSLWNYKEGMYYHDNCYFEGAVDFVCPRGWCYISNSTLKELANTAAVWHAAPIDKNQKFVLQNCVFQGIDSFYLARHHYDAQFYFLRCTFSKVMRDMPIEHVLYPKNTQKNRPYLYGDRYCFYQCKRIGGNYDWFKDNIHIDTVSLITPEWTFDQKWNPLDDSKLVIKKIESEGKSLFLWFDEEVMPIGDLIIITSTGKRYTYYNGEGRKRVELRGDQSLTPLDLKADLGLESGNVGNIYATVKQRLLK